MIAAGRRDDSSGIGLLALSFNAVFRAATGWAFDSALPALGGSGGVDLFKWSLASLLIHAGVAIAILSYQVRRAYGSGVGGAG